MPGGVYHYKKKNGSDMVGFRTYSHPSFRFYGQQFYPKGKKVVPKIIGKILTELGLAIWYADDGSRKSLKHKTFNIHTLAFSKKDLERLQKVLDMKFGIKTSLHRQRDKY